MHKRTAIVLSIALLAIAVTSTGATAQEKTRADVLQELIQAENNGLQFVADASYPDVAPIFELQAAHVKQESDSGMGTEAVGSSTAGKAGVTTARTTSSSCVGPVSFCTPYFGG